VLVGPKLRKLLAWEPPAQEEVQHQGLLEVLMQLGKAEELVGLVEMEA